MNQQEREKALEVHERMTRNVEAAKLDAKARLIIEDHIVRWSQENLPMPAYLQAEMLWEALCKGVLGPYGLERAQGLNVQEAGQAASDRQPPSAVGHPGEAREPGEGAA